MLGTAKVYITNKTVSTTSTAIIADGMSHPALINWHDMIRLKMLPSQFPAYTAALSSSSIQESIFKRFPQVFKDSLTEEPMKTDPVHIHLKENYTPYRVTAARQIPLCFREKAEECVKELIQKKVIAPCHIPTEWCSPALFVVKPYGKNVRMVTDYMGFLFCVLQRFYKVFLRLQNTSPNLMLSMATFKLLWARNHLFSLPFFFHQVDINISVYRKDLMHLLTNGVEDLMR